jgi:hypothetical protein
MKKLVLSVFLGINTLLQLAGGCFMMSAPAKAAREVFALSVSPDVQRAVVIIGAAVLAFASLSLTALIWVLRDRLAGYDLALLFGVAITLIGVVMLALGVSAGQFDVVKGIAIAVAAYVARPRGATTAPDRAAAPPSSPLRAS